MGVSNGDGDGGGVDGDGSGGNSPSRQGAGTENSVPRNLSLMAAELRNFSWVKADSFSLQIRSTYCQITIVHRGAHLRQFYA